MLNSLLNQLHKERSLKAWSVIITFFGDSIAPRGGAVAAATIQSVMQALHIEDGTVRTALSRLGKDDWVQRTRCGRNSYYRLSARGVEEFTKASRKIYAPFRALNEPADRLYLIIPDASRELPAELLENSVKVPRTGALLLRASAESLNHSTISEHLVANVTQDTLPQWLRDSLIPESINERYRQLSNHVGKLLKQRTTDPLTAVALRTIIVHEWRRLLLRPDLAAIDTVVHIAPKRDCYELVATLYHQLTPLAEIWLSESAQGPQGLLPDANSDSKKRFCIQTARAAVTKRENL